MRATTYSRVVDRTCQLIGVARSNLQPDEELAIREAFNTSIKEIWDKTAWPQVCVVEARTPASQFIDYEQAGETEIDTVYGVFDADPDGTTRPNNYSYRLTADGIQLTNSSVTDDVYVWFRKRCPDFNGDAYAAATAYVADDQVYYSTTGDFYKNILASTGNLPSVTTYWERLQIPYDFLEYTAHASYARWLIGEGENERAVAQQQSLADRELFNAIDKVERQQGAQPPTYFSTHLSVNTA